MATLTYLEAIRQALWDEMEQDEHEHLLVLLHLVPERLADGFEVGQGSHQA